MRRSPGTTRRTRSRKAWRPRLGIALGLALLVHAIALVFLRLPAGPAPRPSGPLDVMSQARELAPAAERAEPPAETAGSADRAAGERDRPAPVAIEPTPIPAIRPSPAAAAEATIPPTALVELRAATLPLVPTSGGIGRRRIERSAEELAVARAESLLVARMAGIAVAERRDIGAVGLANGGITLAVPWAGFLPADRFDGEWRRQRCQGGGGGDDKAGEGEARRAGC